MRARCCPVQIKYKEYMAHMKSQTILAPDGKTPHAWYALVLQALFDPSDPTNKKTTPFTSRFLESLAQGVIAKMYDPKGATDQYVGDGARSSTNVSQEMIDDTIGVEYNNDLMCESVFGAFTYIFNMLPNVAVESVSGIVACRRNGFMEREVTSAGRGATSVNADASAQPALFHSLDPRLRRALMIMAMRVRERVHKQAVADRAAHDEYYKKKRELVRAKELEALAARSLNAIDSYEMFAPRGIKSIRELNSILKNDKFKGNVKQITELLKEQIKIRVIGFG